ncbi:hypothetical protein F652_1263 [Enterobacteriaceae bacterium bta3-1]|nr:hypothetical protein F652_1263 [Enterobacteriaceae bacterium bta3-1]
MFAKPFLQGVLPITKRLSFEVLIATYNLLKIELMIHYSHALDGYI